MIENISNIFMSFSVMTVLTMPILICFLFPATSIVCMMTASILSFVGRRKGAISFCISSVIALALFICIQWLVLERPPMRTASETRLWYAFFACISGLLTYVRWKYRWILSFSTILSTVFLLLSIFKSGMPGDELVPALQSPWFIPHVTVYMFSYSLLGCAFLIGLVGLFKTEEKAIEMISSADTLVYIGVAFLTFGMLSGAIWAKSAWGHFWNWDPKETWALITWLSYLIYIHLRLYRKGSVRLWCILLIFAFACLQMCWWGINYLPSAAGSMHVY